MKQFLRLRLLFICPFVFTSLVIAEEDLLAMESSIAEEKIPTTVTVTHHQLFGDDIPKDRPLSGNYWADFEGFPNKGARNKGKKFLYAPKLMNNKATFTNTHEFMYTGGDAGRIYEYPTSYIPYKRPSPSSITNKPQHHHQQQQPQVSHHQEQPQLIIHEQPHYQQLQPQHLQVQDQQLPQLLQQQVHFEQLQPQQLHQQHQQKQQQQQPQPQYHQQQQQPQYNQQQQQQLQSQYHQLQYIHQQHNLDNSIIISTIPESTPLVHPPADSPAYQAQTFVTTVPDNNNNNNNIVLVNQYEQNPGEVKYLLDFVTHPVLLRRSGGSDSEGSFRQRMRGMLSRLSSHLRHPNRHNVHLPGGVKSFQSRSDLNNNKKNAHGSSLGRGAIGYKLAFEEPSLLNNQQQQQHGNKQKPQHPRQQQQQHQLKKKQS